MIAYALVTTAANINAHARCKTLTAHDVAHDLRSHATSVDGTRDHRSGSGTGAGRPARSQGGRWGAGISVAGVDACVGSIVRLPEEPAVHERVEQGIAGGGIEPPQTSNLGLREVKTGDFQKLATDDRQPVGHRSLHRAHVRVLHRLGSVASTGGLALRAGWSIVVCHRFAPMEQAACQRFSLRRS